ncbi:hypothetical protein [Lentzea fradiae]|uniref:hypothetical protein n=1 Tax=Lentzea fradiae TaxID=200378 RepID=UPI00115F92BC|nr:hypothetical protein [Lentzea fradiae]
MFHLRDGAVVAVDSPGSPAAETLLLSSGRVGARDWAAALVASVEAGSVQAALVGRGVIGPAEVRAFALAAVRDGAFAVAAGEVESCEVAAEPGDVPALPVAGGVEPESLLAETARRLDAVASLPVPVAPYRDRVVPAGGVDPAVLTAERREVVFHATGRRTVRDVAFAVGRSLYPVTVEISRMLGEGVLEIASPRDSFTFSHGDLTALRARAEMREAGRPV